MNAREQALQKRVQYLELMVEQLNLEARLAQAVIEFIESVANAYAFDLMMDCQGDFYAEPVANYALNSYIDAKKAGRE